MNSPGVVVGLVLGIVGGGLIAPLLLVYCIAVITSRNMRVSTEQACNYVYT